jgi:hypothetical protein
MLMTHLLNHVVMDIFLSEDNVLNDKSIKNRNTFRDGMN